MVFSIVVGSYKECGNDKQEADVEQGFVGDGDAVCLLPVFNEVGKEDVVEEDAVVAAELEGVRAEVHENER